MHSGPDPESSFDSLSGDPMPKKRRSSGAESSTPPGYNMLDIKPKYLIPMKPDVKIVVAIDFGTTYTGFAYATSSDIENVCVFSQWPRALSDAEVKPYCKTPTSLWYMPGSGTNHYELKDWGWKAVSSHKMAVQNSRGAGSNVNYAEELRCSGYLATKFKLHLAPTSGAGKQTMLTVLPIPPGLTVKRLISDYLRCLSEFILTRLQSSYGCQVSKKDIQWCLSVPTLWNDAAKQQMIDCAEISGLVRGPLCSDRLASPHSLILVLEPEAASVYCCRTLKEVKFTRGSKFLVVDIGGGTVDMVVHEKVDDSGIKVKEIACSTGDMCGGVYIDEAFFRFLSERISCFKEFCTAQPDSLQQIQEYIEKVKYSFNGELNSFLGYLDIPESLAKAWESNDMAAGWWSTGDYCYNILPISADDVISFFTGVVGRILQLMGGQVNANPKLEAILMVGGFSSSPYLMRRIHEEFSHKVDRILNPMEPGSAVCHGAVAFGALEADVMLSRKSRRTYGIASYRTYRMDDPAEKLYLSEDRRSWCIDAFDVFVRKGDDVPIDYSVKHEFYPFTKTATSIMFDMYATSDPKSLYVTDKGMELVGSWTYPIPKEAQKMREIPLLEVDMFFGRTMIEVAANPKNFQGQSTKLSVKFERNFC